jgi:membrane-bound lytic murein transglycosylase D
MHKVVFLFLLLFGIFLSTTIYADNNPEDSSLVAKENQSKTLISKDLIYLSKIDSSTFKLFREPNKQEILDYQSLYGFEKNFVPEYSDSVYTIRLAEMNRRSPMEFEYNEDVKEFIYFYGFRYRKHMSRVMALAELYFPLFDEHLDRLDLPLELKYVAIIESALNPVAKSRAGATGLWQFMLRTGNLYDLQVSSYVDDRCDPIKSTIAACEHFRDLYQIYGDWFLVLSAYNAGPGNVNRALRRANGKTNYWEIKEFMPRETQQYVPRFIAVAYLMEHAGEHNLYPKVATISDYQIDTVMVKYPLDFDLLADSLQMTIEEIEFLNPSFRKGVIPATPLNQYCLRLPYDKTIRFVSIEDSLYIARIREEQRLKEEIANMSNTEDSSSKNTNTSYTASIPSGANKLTHIVASGESIGLIANKYGCSVGQIRSWNSIRGNLIHPGQKITVYSNKVSSASSTVVAKNNATSNTQTNNTSSSKKITSYTYYSVKNGDSLWIIAQKYPGVSVDDIKKANRLSSNNLQIGQSLRIPQF